MKLWATRNSLDSRVEVWPEKPENRGYGEKAGPFVHGRKYNWQSSGKAPWEVFASFSQAGFKKLYKRLPRPDRPMRIELSGRLPK